MPGQEKKGKKEIAEFVLRNLRKKVKEPETALQYKTPFQLLIATILSARCTDKKVNEVTKTLFKKYPDSGKMAQAKLEKLQKMIKLTGFYKTKSKYLKKTSEIIEKKFKGKVPETMEGLTELPGVGRKTANIVLGNAFGKNKGIAVDTHVSRVSYRLGLTRTRNPEKQEKELQKIIPKKEWTNITHYLIYHGRAVCKARVPKCSKCDFEFFCPKKGVEKHE